MRIPGAFITHLIIVNSHERRVFKRMLELKEPRSNLELLGDDLKAVPMWMKLKV